MQPVLFILHAAADAKHEQALSKQLAPFETLKPVVRVLRERSFAAGGSVVQQRRQAIEQADIVVALITPQFWEVHELVLLAMTKKKLVIPVLVSSTPWTESAVGSLRPLPASEEFIESGRNKDARWLAVIQGLKQAWEGLPKQPASPAPTTAETPPAKASPPPPPSPPLPALPPRPALRPIEAPHKLRVLLVAANPMATGRLHLTEEFRQIKARLLPTPNRDRFELLLEPELRLNELAAALMQHRPHIVHFSSHGSPSGEIMLVDPDRAGGVRPLQAASLRQIFHILSEPVHCVVLSACYSAARPEQALALTDVVGSVIGMGSEVADNSAIEFSSSFYQALGFGRTVDQAFRLAQQAIATMSLPGAQVPRLYPEPLPEDARRLF